jgi:Na+-transporting methylmalonyl-CoA/oxaloacetate decarboxylase gamma subunit
LLLGQEISFVDSLLISVAGIFIVFLALILLAVIVSVISKAVSYINDKYAHKPLPAQSEENAPASTSAGTALPETKSAGSLTLIGVAPEEAAVIMAVVSHRSKVPLNRLVFKSIKLMED